MEEFPCCSIGRSSHVVVANILICDIVVIKFKLQSDNHVHFWTNTLGKVMNILMWGKDVYIFPKFELDYYNVKD